MKRALASMLRNLLLAFAGVSLLASSAWGQTASLVRDINTQAEQPASSLPEQMLAVGDKLFFVASQEGSGRELWVSDGSGTGTQMLGDLCPGECDARITLLGSTGGVVLFRVSNSGSQGRQATWRSDGTRKGTFELRSAESEPLLTYDPEELFDPGAVSVAGVVLFPACTPDSRCYLWKSNGTSEGTQRLAEVTFFALIAAGGKAYFLTEKDSDLWTSDGTAAGTRALTSFPLQPFFQTQGLKVFGDHIYFVADDGIHGIEIWRSDGTPGTTRRITELGSDVSIDNGSIVYQMQEVGGRLLFVASERPTGRLRLWKTSGTPQSTSPLSCAGICPELSPFDPLVKTGGRVVFIGSDEAHGRELWSTDGTAAGTALIKEFCPGLCDGFALFAAIVPFSGAAFFVATVGSSPELWTSDGTAAGTRRFADTSSGFQPLEHRPLEIAALGSTLFFAGLNGYGGELWASDGNPGEPGW